jgi:hypothetical protein
MAGDKHCWARQQWHPAPGDNYDSGIMQVRRQVYNA